MKQTSVYAALQFILAQTGYRDTQLPVDGEVWSQADQANWQVLATDKLNVPPRIAHEVPTSLEGLSTYNSIIPGWLDLVEGAKAHAAAVEGETYEPPVVATEDTAADDTEAEGQEPELASEDPVAAPVVEVPAEEPAQEAPASAEVVVPAETSDTSGDTPSAEESDTTAEVEVDGEDADQADDQADGV